ncbi:hypothetical protein FS0810_250002 [Tenacibaculum maritimum]|nr:hypothetical protein FS0810_250002 [Tenacibaculum maritimum]
MKMNKIKIKLIVLLTIFSTIFSYGQTTCELRWDRFSKDVNGITDTSKALVSAIDENSDIITSWWIMDEVGETALRTSVDELQYLSIHLKEFQKIPESVVEEIEKAGGFAKWKDLVKGGSKQVTDAEKALLWGNSKSNFKRAKKALQKSGMLDEFKASYPKLTELEIISVYRYTVTSKINSALNGVPGSVLTDKLKVHQKVLDAALDKLKVVKSYKRDVFRGANLDESLVLSKYKNNIGKEITEDAFTSSSRLEKVADDFIERFAAANKAKVKYTIKSKTGIDVNDMSHYAKVLGINQAEILFKSGTKFKILSVEKNTKGIYEIIMSEL